MHKSLFPDEIQSFSLYRTNIRGRIVRLGKSYSDLLRIQSYPVQIASLLGELTSVSIALADSMKYNGQFFLQTHSDGPVSTMVAHVKYDGTFRRYVNYNERSFKTHSNEGSLFALLGKGHIAFTVDQGKNTKRYQGITSLEGENIAACVERYLQNSEQIPTSVLLIANPDEKRAAAFMIQKMPNEADSSNFVLDEDDGESWQNTNMRMRSLSIEALLDDTISSRDVLYRLFNESDINIYNRKVVKYKCHCSRENIGNSLAAFSTEELQKNKSEERLIFATCEFCKTRYSFSKQGLIKLSNSNS